MTRSCAIVKVLRQDFPLGTRDSRLKVDKLILFSILKSKRLQKLLVHSVIVAVKMCVLFKKSNQLNYFIVRYTMADTKNIFKTILINILDIFFFIQFLS